MATKNAQPLEKCPKCGAIIWTAKARKFHPCYSMQPIPKPSL
jgi:predicted RNA-binding Zn-ribbon protein involved in translation (DUF1610 family)